MKTRCKFSVMEVAQTYWGAEKVKLNAVYGKDGENLHFAESTPSGSMEFDVTNPQVKGSFKPGANYYVDLIPCDNGSE